MRLELMTFCLEGRCSIQLSYFRKVVGCARLELATNWLKANCSTIELTTRKWLFGLDSNQQPSG